MQQRKCRDIESTIPLGTADSMATVNDVDKQAEGKDTTGSVATDNIDVQVEEPDTADSITTVNVERTQAFDSWHWRWVDADCACVAHNSCGFIIVMMWLAYCAFIIFMNHVLVLRFRISNRVLGSTLGPF